MPMLHIQPNGTPSNEGARLSPSLGKLGAEASKKAAAAPPRPLLQPSTADGKEPAMIDSEELKVRGPLPPRGKRNPDAADSAKDAAGLSGLINEPGLTGLADGAPELSETDLAGLCSHLRSERQTLTQLEKNLLNREQAWLQQEQ